MARVTVEDCLEQLNNRFELIMLASKRARDLARGKEHPKVDWENDKTTVVALREIAEGAIAIDYLKKQDEQSVSQQEILPLPVNADQQEAS